MASVYNIDKYNPTQLENFFFDTNVWLYIFFPQGNYELKFQKKYTLFLDKLKKLNKSIFINSLVVSEFSNAYLNKSYQLWVKLPANAAINKKQWRQSQHYTNTLQEVVAIINQLLKVSLKTNDDFNSINLNEVLNEMANKEFNDSYYVLLGVDRNYKIVIHDADIISDNNHNIDVITANI